MTQRSNRLVTSVEKEYEEFMEAPTGPLDCHFMDENGEPLTDGDSEEDDNFYSEEEED